MLTVTLLPGQSKILLSTGQIADTRFWMLDTGHQILTPELLYALVPGA